MERIKGKIPKRRFEGFTDDWEQRKLLGCIQKITDFRGRTPKKLGMDWSESGYLALSALNVKDGYIDFTQDVHYGNQELYDKWMTGNELHKGQVLFTTEAPMGNVAQVPDNRQYILSQRTIAFDVKDDYITENFLATVLRTPKVFEDLTALSSGGTAKGVSQKSLAAVDIIIPTDLKEQEYIARYFANLNNLITLHQRKLEKLKNIKKSYLSEMFPQEDEKKPKRRFKGFTDDWEQRKFSDCYRMSSGYAFKMSDYCDGGIGLINGESIQHGIINDDNLNHLPESFIQQYPDFVLKEGDIVVGLNRPITNGNIKIARIPSKYNDSLLYQRAGKIVYKENCDKNFSYVLLSQEILKHTLVEAVGSDQPFISTSKLDKWQMMIPSNIEEQKKIGNYFRNLDHLITLHQRKLEKLKHIKQAYLNEMFV